MFRHHKSGNRFHILIPCEKQAIGMKHLLLKKEGFPTVLQLNGYAMHWMFSVRQSLNKPGRL